MEFITQARLRIDVRYGEPEFNEAYAATFSKVAEFFKKFGVTKIKDIGSKSVSYDIGGIMECESKDRNDIINKMYEQSDGKIDALNSEQKTGWF